MDAIELFGAEQVERGRRYHRPLYAVSLAGIALDLALLAMLSFTVVGTRLFGALDGWPWPAQTVAYAALTIAITTAAGLPLSFWAGFRREHAWGFSTQTLRGWLSDRAKGLAVGVVLTAGALLGLVALARALPSAWPAAAAGAAAVLVVVLGFLAPLLLEPLFNRFSPLPDEELAADLRALAERAGVPLEGVLVADASRRTRKVNAYVSGLGKTRRLVVYDTLLEQANRAELRLVTAHELGHRRARHLVKGTLLGVAGTALFVLALWALLRWPALRTAIGVDGAADPRVIPFVLLLGTAGGLLGAPLGSALSRRWEREADRFSLEQTHDLEAFESTHRRLAVVNLSDLDPPRAVYLAWFSHPTPAERIEAARRIAS